MVWLAFANIIIFSEVAQCVGSHPVASREI